jgi:hypothetical protein
MTELSDINDIWSYRSFRILIYVEVGGYNGKMGGGFFRNKLDVDLGGAAVKDGGWFETAVCK